MWTPQDIFCLSKKIDKKHFMLNKYTFMAYKYNYPHYRILTIGDLIGAKARKDIDVPGYFLDFVGEQGEVLIIGTILANRVIFIQARSLRGEKRFSVYGNRADCLYGLGFLDKNFKYGDTVLICEGNMDCDCAKGFFNNSLATLTSGLSNNQLKELSYLTNKVIIAYDNDKAGRWAYKRDKEKLHKLGIKTYCLFQYQNYKDIGDLANDLYQGNSYEAELALQYYRTKIDLIQDSL